MESGGSALISRNKACPKDPFPLPHIDAMVDATSGHELLTFLDAYSGYNQILMHPEDQEKTVFMTDKGIYCYKVLPFGLKNAGSTYQRLVMEVYIDDILPENRAEARKTKFRASRYAIIQGILFKKSIRHP